MTRAIAYLLLLCLASVASAKTDFADSRTVLNLKDWQVKTSTTEKWTNIGVDDSWETTFGYQFDGQATYRTTLPAIKPNDTSRILLQFDAVATFAEVFLDGRSIGKHLGGWTAWRIDITDTYRQGAELTVVVDERPGHNTQGFLPVFLPHFGGVWQPVRLIVTKESSYIDDLTMLAAGWSHDRIDIQVTAKNKLSTTPAGRLGVRIVEPEDSVCDWQWQSLDSKAFAVLTIVPSVIHRWSPESPHRYQLEIVLQDSEGRELDKLRTHAAIRRVETRGNELWLNGRPITLRGVLNWGYAPPRIAPSLDPDFMRRELAMLDSYGFNLMKFCLWFPPAEYLELCDEMGMLAWMEYPTWHPKLTQEFLPDLRAEYEEFFHSDRNHPSILLRSLTCETGHSAELDVIKQLYDRAHQLIPESIVEDDSSWIGWHRIHDFYDDHPYGNNHTWRATLDQLRKHISERDAKPLMLGEAIAADTWTSGKSIQPITATENNPTQLHSASEIDATVQRLEKLTSPESVAAIESDSLRNALAMRKFQIERYRYQMPRQGYVVSVIRDFPFAAMGLMNFRGEPKWPEKEWSWHGESMLALETKNDARSFVGGDRLRCSVHGIEISDTAQLVVKISGEFGNVPASVEAIPNQPNSAIENFQVQATLPTVQAPTQATLSAELKHGNSTVGNRWPIWILPAATEFKNSRTWYRHASVSEDSSNKSIARLPIWTETMDLSRSAVIAKHFDLPLFDWMLRGGHVLMLPDGRAGSFPVSDHWFLRGGVVVNREASQQPAMSNLISELQTFDLAGPVMIAPDYLDHVTPWALLWDNHDRKDFRIHALCWLANIGKGRLAVSTLQHDENFGAAGPLVLENLMSGIVESKTLDSFSEEEIERMQSDLTVQLIELEKDGWLFKPDKSNMGLAEHWERAVTDRGDWKPIRIGSHWDGQGFGYVDGWAWYAKRVKLPKDSRYLTFTGVDDYFELYIDGQHCGSGGDQATRKTAFDQNVTLAIPVASIGKEMIDIVVRVEDWQGAGGIFRPVLTSNQPPSPEPPILVRQSGD